MAGYRKQRLESLAREIISDLIIMGEIKDPRIANSESLITVIAVESAKDLSHLRVYISTTGNPADQAKVIAGLDSAKGFIKARISPHVKMKFMPEIVFIPDDSISRGMDTLATIERVMREQKEKNQVSESGDSDRHSG